MMGSTTARVTSGANGVIVIALDRTEVQGRSDFDIAYEGRWDGMTAAIGSKLPEILRGIASQVEGKS